MLTLKSVVIFSFLNLYWKSYSKYNPEKNGEIKTTIHFAEDGETIEYDEEYFPGKGVVYDRTEYVDGKPVFTNLNNEDGKRVEQIQYQEDGTCIVKTYDPNGTNKALSTTHYAEDGVTVIK